MGSLIGHRPYAPVKCFWVEPSGGWLARVLYDNDGNDWGPWVTLGKYDTEEEAAQRIREEWKTRRVSVSSASKAYRLPDGQEVTSGELPPGAMFDAYWLHESIPMTDGITLMVVLPNGVHWSPDQRAGNCTRREDLDHCCWVRRGDPRLGRFHVERRAGDDTCSAGHNSIASLPADDPHHYHGHLQHGMLTAG